MANENKWDSGHVVIPVYHSDSDSIHSIAVPESTPLEDLHSVLLKDGGYEHPGLSANQSGPTEEGTLEESPEFQAATRHIWDSMAHGVKKGESAFYINRNKDVKYEGEQFEDSASGGKQMHINVPADTFAINHIHPNVGQPQLSPKDIETSRHLKMPVYAVSKDGLWTVDGDGKPFQVFKGTDWMGTDFQGDKAFNAGINPSGYTIRVTLKNGKEIAVPAPGDASKYPLDQMDEIKKSGIKGVDPKQVKSVQAFGPGELKPKK
jgi:hypothetical protein